jgi:two-component system sensor histidine kinase DesK
MSRHALGWFPMRIPEQRGEQISGVLWAAVWTWPLLGPAGAVLGGQVRPLVPAAAGLALFVLLYLVVIVSAFNERRPLSQRANLVLLGVLSVVGLSLSAAYTGQPQSWLTPLMYVSVTGGAVLLKWTQFLPWLGFWCLASVGVGALHHQSSSELGAAVFGTLLSSLLVFAVRQMVRLIRELRATQRALADTAVAQERLRFSRDLHDLLGHTLSLMVVKAELARRLAPSNPTAAAREAGDIEVIGRRALAEVREAVTGYRERVLADELDGARAALDGAGIEATVLVAGVPLPGPVDEVFAWTVREGVTNVIRHSGATRATIEVRRTGDRAELSILDNGPRPPKAVAPGRGHGLQGLTERLDALGGSLQADALSAGGFRLAVTAPTTGCSAAVGSEESTVSTVSTGSAVGAA